MINYYMQSIDFYFIFLFVVSLHDWDYVKRFKGTASQKKVYQYLGNNYNIFLLLFLNILFGVFREWRFVDILPINT